MGLEESIIAMKIGTLLNIFVVPRELGLVAGEGGMIQLDINLVRIPDVSFISWDRVPGGELPEEPVPLLVPDLAVEVISRSNTPKEMDEKLREFFEKGVRLVWFVRPRSRVVDVYTAPDRFTRLTASMRAGWRRRPAGFLGPGRRAIPVAEAARRGKGQPKKNGDPAREEERPAARPLKVA